MAVVTCLTGGLGNQMFQYAMGYAVARDNNDKLYIDLSQFKYGARGYALEDLSISGDILKVKPASKNTKFSRMTARIRRLSKTGLFTTKFLQENPEKIYEYTYKDIEYKHSIYLNGFWQSWKYFDFYRNDLISEFTPKITWGGVQPIIEKVRNEESVAVHIRRGDYVNCNGWLIDPQFYITAVDTMRLKIGQNAKFYIFCEDKDFVESFFENETIDYELITGIYTLSDVQEFFVMSACRHKIISNSSFSWWSAYLNADKGQQVIAPVFKQWSREFYLPCWDTINLNEL